MWSPEKIVKAMGQNKDTIQSYIDSMLKNGKMESSGNVGGIIDDVCNAPGATYRPAKHQVEHKLQRSMTSKEKLRLTTLLHKKDSESQLTTTTVTTTIMSTQLIEYRDAFGHHCRLAYRHTTAGLAADKQWCFNIERYATTPFKKHHTVVSKGSKFPQSPMTIQKVDTEDDIQRRFTEFSGNVVQKSGKAWVRAKAKFANRKVTNHDWMREFCEAKLTIESVTQTSMEAIQDFSTAITELVVQPFYALNQAHRRNKRATDKKCSELFKHFDELRRNLETEKTQTITLLKDLIKAHKDSKANSKLASKAAKTRSKAYKSINSYKANFEKVIKFQKSFHEEKVPKYMDQLQDLDKERLDTLHTYMMAYRNAFKTLVEELQSSQNSVTQSVNKLDTDAQMICYVQRMIDNYGTTKPYVPFEYGIPCDADDLLPQNFEECFFQKYLYHDWDTELKRRVTDPKVPGDFSGMTRVPSVRTGLTNNSNQEKRSSHQPKIASPLLQQRGIGTNLSKLNTLDIEGRTSREIDDGKFCQAIYDLYQEPDWLPFTAGEVLRIIDAPNGETGDDWIYCEKEDKTCGYVPKDFVTFDT